MACETSEETGGAGREMKGKRKCYCCIYFFVKGVTYEIGDVVSLLDRGGGIYFAVIRGFMQDQYAEKYAVLTWLLPRYPNPTHFDPADFILGEFEL